MDGERFDELLRGAVGIGSRRGMLRVGVGALAVSALGVFGLSAARDVEAKKGKGKGKKKKKKPTPVQKCSGTSPITCGPGCCSNQAPVCCSDPFLIDGFSCNVPNTTCCPDGLSCRQGFTCCPAEKGDAGGTCLPVGGGACCGPNSGGWCPTGDSCCAPENTNDENEGCCLTGKLCCNPGTPGVCGGMACPVTGCCP